jgi:hypothetical protein
MSLIVPEKYGGVFVIVTLNRYVVLSGWPSLSTTVS